MKSIAADLPGYTYGASSLGMSPISSLEFEQLKISAGFTAESEGYLRLAGSVLAEQTRQIVAQWRSGIIASIPHLARHSRSPDGSLLSEYLARSNLRFEQWILDTCSRPYDQDWLNYQHEIALRHTSVKKNQVDSVRSLPAGIDIEPLADDLRRPRAKLDRLDPPQNQFSVRLADR